MEDKKTKTTKEVELKLNPTVWEVPYNADLVAQVLYVYSSNERKASAKQKGRGEVSGGGKKPWKQKGTGRARAGSTRSPLWVGGGVTFPTHGRNFAKKINKKMTKKATCIMLSERLRNKELSIEKISEKIAKDLRKENKEKILLVSPSNEIMLSLRNSKKLSYMSPEKLNAKHLVSARKILMDNDSVKILEERLANGK